MKQNIFSKYAAYLLIALPLGGVGGGSLHPVPTSSTRTIPLISLQG